MVASVFMLFVLMFVFQYREYSSQVSMFLLSCFLLCAFLLVEVEMDRSCVRHLGHSCNTKILLSSESLHMILLALSLYKFFGFLVSNVFNLLKKRGCRFPLSRCYWIGRCRNGARLCNNSIFLFINIMVEKIVAAPLCHHFEKATLTVFKQHN